jgi:hypothetical protein
MKAELGRRAVLACAMAALLLAGTTALVWAGGVQPNHALLDLFKTPGTGYPSVAAVIDGREVSGQYMAYAVKQIQQNAATAGKSVTRTAAVNQVVDRLASAAAIAKEAARRGYSASEDEVTAYLQQQTDGAVQLDPASAAAVWAANGDADANAYIHDPAVRALAARMIAGSKMFAALTEADPKFDVAKFTQALRSKIMVEVRFTP